jgi:hypothetical protein
VELIPPLQAVNAITTVTDATDENLKIETPLQYEQAATISAAFPAVIL